MNDRPEWFAAKRYGFGTGWPIRWQGWTLLAAFMVIVIGVVFLLKDRPAVQLAILLSVLAAMTVITARTTRGGWRWRWGRED